MAIFLAWRPWLLLPLAAGLARWPWRRRAAGHAAALLLASGSEAALCAMFGGGGLAAAAARAVLAGAAMAMLLDAGFVAARLAEPRFARVLGCLIGLGLLLVPAPRLLFERIALAAPPPPVAGPRPAVILLSGLPLLWAEDAPAARPNAVMRRLQAEFQVRPIDAVTPALLARGGILLAAQPRAPGAAGIAAIDARVRAGGRALLFVDPDLRWPGDLPRDDPRRPPAGATLAPLLAGWGLAVAPAPGDIATIDVNFAVGAARRIVTDRRGTIRAAGNCRMAAGGAVADCRIGRGRAIVVADADLLDDRLWVAPGPDGDGRLRRGGDNAVAVAEWLDALAGIDRDRSADSVSWRRRPVPPWAALAALLPALAAGLSAMVATRRRGGR